jgi:AraC-like DNA-binding protein
MNTEHTALVDQSRLVSFVRSSISWAQLERGKLDVGYQVVEIAPLVFSTRTLNLAAQMEGTLRTGKTAVATVEALRPGARWLGQEVDAGTVAVACDDVDLRTTGPTTISAIAFDEQELQLQFPDSLDVADLLDGLKRRGNTRNPVEAARLRTAIRGVCSAKVLPAQSVTGSLVPLLAAALVKSDPYSAERNDAATRRFAAVRVCERYMREHLDRRLTMLDLSRASGIRSRTLINAFEAITGFAPMDYLKRLRLSAVHRALQVADRSQTRIIDVAMEWGFWHMGHFARDYHAMFGESPSRTLLG